MFSAPKILHAMDTVNAELVTHFEHLSNPELPGPSREAIGRFAAEGVRRGCTVVAMHQLHLSQQLDELEALALAGQS